MWNFNFRCFDKATVFVANDDDIKGTPNPWKLCTVTQVEELKVIIRILPIWPTGIISSAVYNQMSTMFVIQGNTMDQHIGPTFKIPAASLTKTMIAWVASIYVWLILFSTLFHFSWINVFSIKHVCSIIWFKIYTFQSWFTMPNTFVFWF